MGTAFLTNNTNSDGWEYLVTNSKGYLDKVELKFRLPKRSIPKIKTGTGVKKDNYTFKMVFAPDTLLEGPQLDALKAKFQISKNKGELLKDGQIIYLLLKKVPKDNLKEVEMVINNFYFKPTKAGISNYKKVKIYTAKAAKGKQDSQSSTFINYKLALAKPKKKKMPLHPIIRTIRAGTKGFESSVLVNDGLPQQLEITLVNMSTNQLVFEEDSVWTFGFTNKSDSPFALTNKSIETGFTAELKIKGEVVKKTAPSSPSDLLTKNYKYTFIGKKTIGPLESITITINNFKTSLSGRKGFFYCSFTKLKEYPEATLTIPIQISSIYEDGEQVNLIGRSLNLRESSVNVFGETTDVAVVNLSQTGLVLYDASQNPLLSLSQTALETTDASKKPLVELSQTGLILNHSNGKSQVELSAKDSIGGVLLLKNIGINSVFNLSTDGLSLKNTYGTTIIDLSKDGLSLKDVYGTSILLSQTGLSLNNESGTSIVDLSQTGLVLKDSIGKPLVKLSQTAINHKDDSSKKPIVNLSTDGLILNNSNKKPIVNLSTDGLSLNNSEGKILSKLSNDEAGGILSLHNTEGKKTLLLENLNDTASLSIYHKAGERLIQLYGHTPKIYPRESNNPDKKNMVSGALDLFRHDGRYVARIEDWGESGALYLHNTRKDKNYQVVGLRSQGDKGQIYFVNPYGTRVHSISY